MPSPPPSSAPTSSELPELLKAWALELGFDRAGVASLEPLERGDVYLRWLERGDHAGMDYLAARMEERLRPAEIFPGARSALCVALQYHPLEGGEEARGDLWPRVARYARGRDYHNLMGKRLSRLARRIRREIPGANTRTYVDTGPVLERELAARAGLGALGKNTCLLSREMGSWFLLGEIFLSLDLAREAPVADLCGRCTRCLDACPTAALPAPYHLDARKCISYWTIEHRGAIPAEVRPEIGEWVFGCDICQEVCPWNGKERRVADHPDLLLSLARADLDLPAVLALSPEEYEERFRGSAMKRARREGLQRNAAVVMGNRRDPSYREPLAAALAGADDPNVRGAAAWALGRLGDEEARRSLERALEGEENPEVRAEISAALGTFKGPESEG